MDSFVGSWAFMLLMLGALVAVCSVGLVLLVVFIVQMSKRNRDL